VIPILLIGTLRSPQGRDVLPFDPKGTLQLPSSIDAARSLVAAPQELAPFQSG